VAKGLRVCPSGVPGILCNWDQCCATPRGLTSLETCSAGDGSTPLACGHSSQALQHHELSPVCLGFVSAFSARLSTDSMVSPGL